MPRVKQVDRPVSWNLTLPTSLAARVGLELYSELEGKIPFAARQKFVIGLIEEYFRKKDAAAAQGQKKEA